MSNDVSLNSASQFLMAEAGQPVASGTSDARQGRIGDSRISVCSAPGWWANFSKWLANNKINAGLECLRLLSIVSLVSTAYLIGVSGRGAGFAVYCGVVAAMLGAARFPSIASHVMPK